MGGLHRTVRRVQCPPLRFRDGLVCKAHRHLYHSTLGLRVTNVLGFHFEEVVGLHVEVQRPHLKGPPTHPQDYFAEMRSGSEEGLFSKLVHFDSQLGSRVIKRKKRHTVTSPPKTLLRKREVCVTATLGGHWTTLILNRRPVILLGFMPRRARGVGEARDLVHVLEGPRDLHPDRLFHQPVSAEGR